MTFTLYTPPTVTLTVFFEFSVRFKYGLVLDTKGIREAIEESKPEKALNSFALKDTFDGVDEPLVLMTCTVGFEVEVSAVIVAISVGGSITLTATIDFYDPYPDTSEGLVRPFEMFSFSMNPADWFEFTVSLTLELSVSISVGIFLGFVKIVLYKYTLSMSMELIPLLYWAPGKPDPIVSCHDDKTMTILHISNDQEIQCTSLDGSLGDETIECVKGDFIQTCYNVASVHTEGGAVKDLIIRDIQSPTEIKFAPTRFELDYIAGATIISDDAITITETGATLGSLVSSFSSIADSTVLLPKPDQSFLTTTIGGDCNNPWIFEGHTNLQVNAAELGANCNIIANGGSRLANAVIDFSTRPCSGFYEIEVTFELNPNMTKVSYGYNGPIQKSIKIASLYDSLEIIGSDCVDRISVQKTLNNSGTITIDGAGGDDEISIGSSTLGEGLDLIFNKIIVKGGDGNDTLVLDDSGSSLEKTNGFLTSSMVRGLVYGKFSNGTYIKELEFAKIEELQIKLSRGRNIFNVTSTPVGSNTTITGSPEADEYYISETQGDITLYAGSGDDTILITGLGDNATASIYGDLGEDHLEVDGSCSSDDCGNEPVNSLDSSTIKWNGGQGSDNMLVFLTSTGDTLFELSGDSYEGDSNTLQVECVDFNCTLLSRATFIANIHGTPVHESERINFNSANSKLANIIINLNGGYNKAYFDDTMGAIDIFGGQNDDGKICFDL